MKRILYLGWLGQGNVGDELLFQTFQQLIFSCPRAQGTHIQIDGFIPLPNYHTAFQQYDLVVLGGGSLLHLNYWLDRVKEAQAAEVPTASFGTGVDGMFKDDPATFRGRLKLPAPLAEKISSAASAMSFISCRGPYSRIALEESGIDPAKIRETGDPALFFSHRRDRATPGGIFISWGTAKNNILGGNEPRLNSELSALIGRLAGEGHRITIAPAWVEDLESAKALQAGVSSPNVTLIEEVPDPFTFSQLLLRCECSLNFKLHPNVLSAALDRPFIGLGYRGKCFDFAETVESRDCMIATDEVSRALLYDKLTWVRNNRGEVVRRFAQARERYRPQIDAFFGSVMDLLSL